MCLRERKFESEGGGSIVQASPLSVRLVGGPCWVRSFPLYNQPLQSRWPGSSGRSFPLQCDSTKPVLDTSPRHLRVASAIVPRVCLAPAFKEGTGQVVWATGSRHLKANRLRCALSSSCQCKFFPQAICNNHHAGNFELEIICRSVVMHAKES